MLASWNFYCARSLKGLFGIARNIVLASLMFLPFSSQAFSPFVVGDIRVDGIQRIEPGTIFAQLPVKVGQRFTDELATESVRRLYATGLFSYVRIETNKNVVVVVVQEKHFFSYQKNL